ncbi:hypothetical protein GobsT_19960 [Gemmata obscuriglobus]|uniref:Uncharacterized protein n=1 Tax=Gemmata obscuriglobus TaxID=114 RepID=A0A2Z3H9H1_9BACT|nr:hypothetical protein [Gemmata obscuriglobus]AWM39655.1 hypothetical protein C1280_23410 [Gemmata obscuriglobus]QEG27242.1 hypothetical protein GobsT_19960 [Gemmata obscuriglobus]VTS03998.1 unnamed protein product [Gemmata obscuriglobus UQM 2246]
MLTSFVLSMTLAAPVPPPGPAVPVGPAPRILELKPGADGKIMVTVTRTEKLPNAPVAANPNGIAPAVVAREISRTKVIELSEVKDLTVTTADGKKIATEDALKTLSTGAIVVVSTDGKPVSPTFLKMFKDDVLVLVSPELSGPATGRPVARPLPAIQGGIQVLPAQPGIQIQVAPVQIAPAVPAQVLPGPLPPAPGK